MAAILAALEHRDRTGQGQYIDFSQMEAAMHLMAPLFLDETVNGRTATRHGNADLTMAPHAVVRTAPATEDKWIAVACETDEQWQNLAGLLGREDLMYMNTDQRLSRAEELEALVAEWAAPQDAGQLQELFQRAGIPAHQVQNSTECVADPQLEHRHHFRNVPHPTFGDSYVEAPAFTLSRSPYGPQWAGPTMGQHTFEVLTDLLGYDGDRIADLAAAGGLE